MGGLVIGRARNGEAARDRAAESHGGCREV